MIVPFPLNLSRRTKSSTERFASWNTSISEISSTNGTELTECRELEINPGNKKKKIACFHNSDALLRSVLGFGIPQSREQSQLLKEKNRKEKKHYTSI